MVFKQVETSPLTGQLHKLTLQQQLDNALPGGHLHTILDFYAFDRENLKISYDKVLHCIKEELQARVEAFGYGSVVTGLALKKESDIDLYLSPCNSPPILYDEVVKRLRGSNCFSGITPVRNARVPIIQCKHMATGLSVDLNMSNPFGIYNSRFVAELLKCDERLRELFLFLKIWATEVKLIGRRGMTSHCLVSMIIVSLQVQKLLPSIQQMQSLCPPMLVQDINFAYSLHPPPMVPGSMCTRQLIANFFNFYSTLDFGECVVSPFLGRGVDKCVAQDNFQLDTTHCICVQDPFELKQNLARSFSETNLHYFRQSLVLAAQAYSDQALIWQPKKLYDYLLFGIAKELVAENNQREQPIRINDHRLVAVIQPTRDHRTVPIIQPTRDHRTVPIIQPTRDHRTVPIMQPTWVLPNTEAVQNAVATPIRLTTTIDATKGDLKVLRPIRQALILQNEFIGLNTYWWTCQLNTIWDVLTQVYRLNITTEVEQQRLTRWLISANLDTWSGRNLRPGADQSFLSHQVQQSNIFLRTRPGNPAYEVNVSAYLTVSVSAEYDVLRIDMEPLPEDVLGLRRNGPLEKLFSELKHLLTKYSFKERASVWRTYRQQPRRDEITIHKIIVGAIVFLSFYFPFHLLVVFLVLMALPIRNYVLCLILDSFWKCLNDDSNTQNAI